MSTTEDGMVYCTYYSWGEEGNEAAHERGGDSRRVRKHLLGAHQGMGAAVEALEAALPRAKLEHLGKAAQAVKRITPEKRTLFMITSLNLSLS